MSLTRFLRRLLFLPPQTQITTTTTRDTPFTRDMDRIRVASETRQRDAATHARHDTGNLIEAAITGRPPEHRS